MTANKAPASGDADVPGDAPLLADLMPWSVPSPRTGRTWVTAPDPASLQARWRTLLAADGTERDDLFQPTRGRDPHTPAAQLPGQSGPTAALAEEPGDFPSPVPVLHGPYDRRWLIPDHRLLDAARPELWRVADAHQVFAVEQARPPRSAGGSVAPWTDPGVVFSALLPDGHTPDGRRGGRIRPLYRRPGGLDPNTAPGLLDTLADRLGLAVSAPDLLAFVAAAVGRGPGGTLAVPLPRSAELWVSGVALGRRLLWAQTHGERFAAEEGARPRLPGGRRPYVRAPIHGGPQGPGPLAYDPREGVLHLGEGRIAPVPPGAWDATVGGVRVLEHWYGERTAAAEPGSLDAVRAPGWPATWTSELLELITVLGLLAELHPEQRRLARHLARSERVSAAELGGAGVLPVPAAARRPASVLEHPEEGAGGQFALL